MKSSNKEQKDNDSLDIDKLSENSELSGFSEEERAKVYEEMEQLFTHAHSKKSATQYDISGAPAGIKLPLLFNLFLIVFVASAIIVTTTLLNIREKRSLSAVTDVQASNSALAQEIIEQNKTDLDNKSKELDNIQAELEALLSGQKDISEIYAQRINNYEAGLRSDIDNQLGTLRKNLEEQNFSEEEINARLEEQKIKLEKEFNTKLAKYKDEQKKEQQQKEAENQERIASLQAEKNKTQEAILSLQNDIQQKEAELEAQNLQTNQKLSEAQQNLQQLREEKEEKDKAFKKFELVHNSIMNSAKNSEFVKAMEEIQVAENDIRNSKYVDEPEARILLTNYEVYKIILTPLQGLNSTNVANTELESQIETLNNEIENIKEENKKTVLALNTKNAELNNEISNLQTTLNNTQNELSQARTLISAGESELEKILGNIRLISNYLALRSTGIEDAETRQIISSLTNDSPIYKSVVDILSVAINANSQGELSGDFLQ